MNRGRRDVAATTRLPDDVNVVVTGDGPHTVVLLHGFSDNLSTWRRIVPALAVEHRVVAIDLPGHGATTRAFRAPLLNGYAAVVLEVLDGLGVHDPVSLVGNSMGAAVSAVLAAGHPERIAGAVLIGMPGVTGVPMAWRAAASRPASIAMRTALRPIPVGHLQRSFGWIYAHAACPRSGALDPAVLQAYSATYGDRARLFGLSEIARALLSELRTIQLGRLLPRLRVPVLQVWGRHDRLVPPRRVVEREDMVVLPGCGHCPQLDSPDQLLGVLVPFLDRHRSVHEQLLSRAAGV
ncbi:MAG TPA: alpha/beta fold hydrolase [Jatrophihabitans sp.]|jgi:pimeloyl-ACP methyl ester carboxylesterase